MSQGISLSSTLPRHLWAKGRQGQATDGESLAFHTASVAAMLCQLAVRAPALAQVAGEPRLWHRAFWACWLHDLGKAAQPFQSYLRGQSGAWGQRHEVLSLAFLPWVIPVNSEDFPWVASAIASHHREAATILQQRYDPDLPIDALGLGAMVAGLEDEAILALARWTYETAPAWLASTILDTLGVRAPSGAPAMLDLRQFRQDAPAAIIAALHAYRALWQSHREATVDDTDRRQGVLLRGLVILADRLASGHATAIQGLAIPSGPELLRRAGASSSLLHCYQTRAGATNGSIVLAAPTGSGKTEAALLWARQQLGQGGTAAKLIYLLPYQASLNAMRSRLRTELSTEVGLLHGRSAQVLYRELTDQGYTGRRAERAARRATDLTRLHHPPVWIATPYQLLRAAYRLPGYETIWTSLAGALVIIDEPHAYEPKRLGLLLGFLGELVRHWNVRICAMTATLPDWLRRLLEETLATTSLPIDRELFAQFKRHQIKLIPGEIVDQSVVKRIAHDVEAGRSVLVGVNTVARAQIMRTMLDERLGADRVRLLHSRFTGRDRLSKEQEILDRVRAGGSAGSTTGLAVVATQVIEVSLELDFDTIFTEPAPFEALAQRFGRVNRRGNKGIVPVHVLTAPTDGQGVYDRRLVERTIQRIAAIDGQSIDEATLGEHMDAVYRGDLEHEYVQSVNHSRQEFESLCIQSLHAFQSDEGLEQVFDQLFEGTEVLPASLLAEYRRLVDESVLEAQALLVPIRDSQRHRLGTTARWEDELRLWIVDVPYSADAGLQLPGPMALPSE